MYPTLGPNFLILVVCAFEERIANNDARSLQISLEISKKLHSIWKGTDDTRKREEVVEGSEIARSTVFALLFRLQFSSRTLSARVN